MHRKWIYIFSFIMFMFISVSGIHFGGELLNAHKAKHARMLTEVAANHAYSLKKHLHQSLSATYALSSILQLYGEIKDFDKLAATMIKSYGGISSLQLAPNGVLSQIYPLKGNEKAIGHDLLNDPKRKAESMAAINSRKLTLAGPFELKQGGIAVIGRLPVFLKNKSGAEYFWGFTIALIKLPGLIREANLKSLVTQGYEYELSRIHPVTEEKHVFSMSDNTLGSYHSSFTFDVPNGRWSLSISQKSFMAYPWRMILFIAVILVGLMISFTAFSILNKSILLRQRNHDLDHVNQLLNDEIISRNVIQTSLQESEAKYRALIDHAGDPILMADIDGNIIDANKTALELTGYSKNELLEMHALDMRNNPPTSGQWLSPLLVTQMEKTLANGEQVILFLNRRGYAPLTLCRTCGHRLECPNCTAWLVEHRHRRNVQCHHCGYNAPVPDQCPSCEDEDSMVACGPGVERLTEEVINTFPSAHVAMMTSDTMTSPAKTAAMVGQITSGELDIIIGTQVVTKGYHFPKLTLVGVVDADLGLRGGDLRAGERTYQQLVQVSGRAGRADRAGQVYLQSYEPEHPVVQALLSGDGEAFMEAEMDVRKRFSMPPFGKLVAILITGVDLSAVAEAGRRLAACAPREAGMEVLGPAPAPLARIKGAHRYRMLFHASKEVDVQGITRVWLRRAGTVKGVKIKADVDPYSFG